MKMHAKITVPLIIDGADVRATSNDHLFEANSFGGLSGDENILVQGADPELCILAVESSSKAFTTWRKTTPDQRSRLFQRLAQVREWLIVPLTEKVC
jgi:acyl-CoA reductase-like NAD-dependent aldehyde dehydrogenase